MAKEIVTLSDVMEKAYRIGEQHANVGKAKMPTDQLVETYFSGPDMAVLFAEYALTRKELHDIYIQGWNSMHGFMQKVY